MSFSLFLSPAMSQLWLINYGPSENELGPVCLQNPEAGIPDFCATDWRLERKLQGEEFFFSEKITQPSIFRWQNRGWKGSAALCVSANLSRGKTSDQQHHTYVWTSHKQFLQREVSTKLSTDIRGIQLFADTYFLLNGLYEENVHWSPISYWCDSIDSIDFPGKTFEWSWQRQSAQNIFTWDQWLPGSGTIPCAVVGAPHHQGRSLHRVCTSASSSSPSPQHRHGMWYFWID